MMSLLSLLSFLDSVDGRFFPFLPADDVPRHVNQPGSRAGREMGEEFAVVFVRQAGQDGHEPLSGGVSSMV